MKALHPNATISTLSKRKKGQDTVVIYLLPLTTVTEKMDITNQ